MVTVAALQRRVEPRGDRQAESGAGFTQALLDKNIVRRVLHDATFAHLAGLQFELRLDQTEQGTAGLEQRYERW